MRNTGFLNIFKLLPVILSAIAVFLVIFSVIFFRPALYNINSQTVKIIETTTGNVTDSSFTLLIKTDIAEKVSVEYGALGAFNLKAFPVKKEVGFYHLIKIESLSPLTEYNFRIVDGQNRQISKEVVIKTGPVIAFPYSQPFFGRIFDKNGTPVSGSYLIVKVLGETAKNTSLLIAPTEENGSFTFNTGSARNEDFSAYAFKNLSEIEKIEITGKIPDGQQFSLSLNAPFEKLPLGAVQLGELKTEVEYPLGNVDLGWRKSLWGIKPVFASNTISFNFPLPGRWDIVIYSPLSTPIGAEEFLSKINSRCNPGAYWLDRLENGAWESFILKDGTGYGSNFPVTYTKAYFIVVEKAGNNCDIEI